MSKYKTYGVSETPQLTELILIEGWEDKGVFSVDEPEITDNHCAGCYFENEPWSTCIDMPCTFDMNFHLTTHNTNE